MSVVNTGTFIVVEGIDGVGKSTLIKNLKTYLENSTTNEVVVTREPGATELGQQIRSILLTPGQKIDPIAELLLFYADRAQHIADVIRPAMERNAIVLCDRYDYSTVAYQQYGRNVGNDYNWDSFFSIANDWYAPCNHVVLYLHVDSPRQVADRLKNKSLDRMEQESIDFYQRVIDGYRSQELDNWIKIDIAGMNESEVAICTYAELELYRHEHPKMLPNIQFKNT